MHKNAKIMIIMHKPYPPAEDGIYLPILVGAAGKENIEAIPNATRDDTGENISEENPYFCELTGLYWAWKNLEADYIGLVHYRRYFKGKGKGDKRNKVLRRDRLEKLLQTHSVILPKKRKYYIETLYSHYAHTMSGVQLDIAREIVSARTPEYLPAFDKVMKQRSGHMFNMFVMRRDLFDHYCEWLFPILFELKDRVDKTGMSEFELRFCGRVSEILLNVWLRRMEETNVLSKKDIVQLPVIYMEKVHYFKKMSCFLKAKLFHKKYDKSF